METIIPNFENDFPMGVVIIGQQYQPCNINDWISEEKAHIGHMYHVKFGKIPEFKRMKHKNQSYCIISPTKLIEPLQPVRKHKKLLTCQYMGLNQMFIDKKYVKNENFAWFYGSFDLKVRTQRQRIINGSGCVLIHYCDNKECENPRGCYQHIDINDSNLKIPLKWELECHCGFGLNDDNDEKICLQSSLQGLIRTFVCHGQSAQDQLKGSFVEWLLENYGIK